MVNILTDIMTGITTEPTRYALIIAFITSVIVFLLNEWAKRRYLIHEKLLSLRLERFESLLQELYIYAEIYEDIKMIEKIKIDDVSNKTKIQLIASIQRFENLFSKSILSQDEILKAKEINQLEDVKDRLKIFLLRESEKNLNNIAIKASNLHLIMPDRIIQIKAGKIAGDIANHIKDISDNKDYSDKISEDIKNLVDSMRTYLPSLSLID